MITDLHATRRDRRHDLDALRAVAMLLGIGLHAAMSFVPFPWAGSASIQDSRQNVWFSVYFVAVHGFRMPLFFLLSGFFTALLWRRSGLKSLLQQRFRRVFLPFMLFLVTAVPLANIVERRGFKSELSRPLTVAAAGVPASTSVWIAARNGDLVALNQVVANQADVNRLDPTLGLTPLCFAAASGQYGSAKVLIEKGANVRERNGDAGTPLHIAAFFGRAEVAALLLEHGADLHAKNDVGATPLASTLADWSLTKSVARSFAVPVEEKELQTGRARVVEILRPQGAALLKLALAPKAEVRGWNTSRWISKYLTGISFRHLWFLWLLCWVLVGFAAYARISDWLKWQGLPKWLVLSPMRYLWLIPLTMVPQWFMGMSIPSFGPDTSIGILPLPQVLSYYMIFFGFGVLYYDCDDAGGRVGSEWWLALPVGLLVLLPLGFDVSFGGFGLGEKLISPALHRVASVALQVTYAWLMTFGMMGLFRRLLTRDRQAVRYLSDASYWFYLAHFPLVIGTQVLVRGWPLPAMIKFALVCAAVCAVLLFTYQTMVRYTWLGTFLNGPRTRHSPADHL